MSVRRVEAAQNSLAIAVFLISLQSIYFYGLGVAPFPYAGVLLLFFCAVFFSYGRQTSIQPLVILLPLFCLCFIAIFFTGFGNGTALVAGFFCSTLLSVFFVGCSSQLDLERALKLSILVHLCFFFSQVIYFVLFTEMLDILEPITGENSRQMSRKGIMLGELRVPRFSGLFNEPGTYGCYFGSLLAFYALSRNRWSKLEALGLLSLIISMSAYSFVAAVFILVTKFFKHFEWRFRDLVIFCLGTLVVVVCFLMINARIGSGLMELGFRLAIINDFLSGGAVDIILGKDTANVFSDFGGPVNDVGLWFVILYDYGIIAFVTVCFLTAYAIYKWSFSASPLILLLLVKIKFSYPFFWLFFLFFLFQKKSRDLN